jgi:hypothetical protein
MPPQERRRSARGRGAKTLSERRTHFDGLSTVLGRGDGEEAPFAGYALEFVSATVFKFES